MVKFFGDLAATTALNQGRRRSTFGDIASATERRRSTLRRGSDLGERLEHTIHLTSHSSTPSAHEPEGISEGTHL